MMPGSGVARTLMIIVLVFVVLGLILAMAGTPSTPS
jgi:hypothetical protein